MSNYTPAEIAWARRCAPLDRPPASYRDGTRSRGARTRARDMRAARALKRSVQA